MGIMEIVLPVAVCFIVTAIEERGFLRVTNIGGVTYLFDGCISGRRSWK